MSRGQKILLIVLGSLVVGGIIYLAGLYSLLQRVQPSSMEPQLNNFPAVSEPLESASGEAVRVRLFRISAAVPGTLEPTEVTLHLPSDPAHQARLLIEALASIGPLQQRPLPPSTRVLEAYALPNGLVVVDFASSLLSDFPAGILSEQLAVESLLETLGANLPSLRALKILVGGQEATTLAGHIDLTSAYRLTEGEAPQASLWLGPH
jgi:hypothetical protein